MTCCGRKKKNLRVQDTDQFVPNFHKKPITEKFYARHDNLKSMEKYSDQITIYAEEIERRQKFDARRHQLVPRTTNQDYGWLEYLADPYDTGYDTELFRRQNKMDKDIKLLDYINVYQKQFKMLTRKGDEIKFMS